MIDLVLAFSLVGTSTYADFTSPVVSVFDGDTIEVLHSNRAERIRLSGIDCPEKGQAYGQKAKHAASTQVFGKEVTFRYSGSTSTGAPLPMFSYVHPVCRVTKCRG